MNWAAFRHLWWVLLVLNGVGADNDEPSTRSSPTKILKVKRPSRSDIIGNTIKRIPDDGFKPLIPSDEPLPGSTVSPLDRLTSKRVNSIDYLARNTVPVAPATESLRKFPKLRPPPSHLLAYQAASSTEKGIDSQIPPTGWALASLGPSKDVSSLLPKRSNLPLTPKPLNSYWSSRLHRTTQIPTTPLEPGVNFHEGNEKNGTISGIPAENLIQNESKLEIKSHQLINSSSTDDTFVSTSLQNQAKDNELKDKSVTKETVFSSTTQATLYAGHNTPNIGKNLIKEVRSGDSGSSVLKGVVLATSSYRYAEDAKLDNSVLGPTTEVSAKSKKPDESGEGKSSSVARDEVNSVQLFPPVVKQSIENSAEMPNDASVLKSTEVNETISFVPLDLTPLNSATSESVVTTAVTLPEGTSNNVSSLRDLNNIESKLNSTTTETNYLTTTDSSHLMITTQSTISDLTTVVSEMEQKNGTNVLNTTSAMPISETATLIETTTEMLPTIPNKESSTSPATTTSLVEVSTKTQSEVRTERIPDITDHSVVTTEPSQISSTISPESNDIPEAFTDTKKGMSNVTELPEKTKKYSILTTEKPSSRPDENESTTTTVLPSTLAPLPPNSSSISLSATQNPTTTEPYDSPTLPPSTTESSARSVPRNNVQSETSTPVTTLLPDTYSTKSDKTTTHAITINDSATPSVISSNDNSSASVTKHTLSTQSTTNQPTTQYVDVTTTITPNVTGNTRVKAINATDNYLEKNDNEDDETLKYNVTMVDQPLEKAHNTTEQDLDYENNDKEGEDETEKENEPQTTTTLIIIEEITTSKPLTTHSTTETSRSTTMEPTTTKTTTEQTSEIHTTNQATTSIPVVEEDSSTDPKLLLTFQASIKEMCLARESLTESLAAFIKGITMRPINPNQIKIFNLGLAECSSKTTPPMSSMPLIIQVTDNNGKWDQNLTELLYSYMKQGRFNFKYPLTNVALGIKFPDIEDEWGGTVIAAIVVSSVAGLSLLFLTVLLVIMRKRQKGFTYGQRCTPVSLEDYSLDNISVFNSVRRKTMRASKRSYGNPAFDDPVTVTNPLNFVGLSGIANSHSKIDNEYSEVPTVTVKPDELPLGAETKNRYANVIPIPETRVPLSSSDGGEAFINANYVKGAKGAEKFYIACQAPLESTIPDFWMMIWEQQAQVVLMLTDLHENGTEKSADYLPPSEVLDCHRVFGDLQVTLKKREVREKYVISSLQLKNLESNLWREVIHLWYTGWPIRGVPDDLTSIIAYLIEARSYSKPGHPIVVHCSPGTGRTGTVVAIDIAIRDFETDRIVDIPKTVYSIRRDRAGAVQTNMQYYLIYQVIHLYATKLTGGSLD